MCGCDRKFQLYILIDEKYMTDFINITLTLKGIHPSTKTSTSKHSL